MATISIEGIAAYGAPDDSGDGTPGGGIDVRDPVTDNSATSAGDGSFTLEIADVEELVLHSHTDDAAYIDEYFVITQSTLDTIGWEDLEVEVADKAHEEFHYERDFGGLPYSEDHGTVLIELLTFDNSIAVGTTIDIDLDYFGAIVLTNSGDAIPTNTLPANADINEVAFARVEPGTAAVTVTPPDGAEYTCSGPATIPVVANALTLAAFLCG